MKKLIFTTAIVLLAYMLSAQWIKQTLIPEDANFNDIFFSDQNHGWCVGDNLAHYSTINGGDTWELMDNLIATYVDNVHFTDQNNGWVGGFEGIWHTNNGGYGTNGNWAQQWDPSAILISANPFFIDSLNGWITTYWDGVFDPDFSSIYHTTDGGNNWNQEINTYSGNLTDITFTNSLNGWAVGRLQISYDYKTVVRTSDGGHNWDFLGGNFNDIQLTSVCFIDSLKGWTTGIHFPYPYSLIYHTLDGGITWEQQGDTLISLNLLDITFVDNLNGWAVGSNGTILRTSNGGLGWEFQESGTLASLTSIKFVNQDIGWICGDSGVILHTNNGGIVRQNEIIKPENKLTIYPNPIGTITLIEYCLNTNSQVTIQILDISGQEIRTLINENEQQGKQQIIFNTGDLPTGIYFCILKTNEGIQTRKIIKL